MSGVGFGSVGDIIAVAQLAYRLAQALSESRGSSAEYQDLIIELDALAGALKGLDEIIARQPLDTAVRNAIKHAVGRCWSLMSDFLGRIDGYKSSLEKKGKKEGGANKWKAVWRSIGWMLFKKEELVELREKLSDQKVTITMMLTLSQCASLSKVESKMQEKASVVVDPAPTPKKDELMDYIQQVIDSQRADTQKSYQDVLEAMKQTAQEQVPFNLQGYMDEFSKSIASEVRVLLGEVGQLRDERSQLQNELGELKKLRSQMGPTSMNAVPPHPPPSPPPPPMEAYNAPSPQKPAWRNVQQRPRRNRGNHDPLPPLKTKSSWETWEPSTGKLAFGNFRPTDYDVDGSPIDLTPSPPPEYTGRTSPGLFGPRSPAESVLAF